MELANSSARGLRCNVIITGYDGKEKLKKRIYLRAHQQIHINAGSYLEPNQSGLFVASQGRVQSKQQSISYGLAATGVSYYHNDDGSIKATSSAGSVLPVIEKPITSYNLYLDSENWLRLFNFDNDASSISISIIDVTGDIIEKQFTIQPMHGIEIPLHEFSEYGTLADTYGEIIINGVVIGEMVRVGKDPEGDIDFIITTPIGYTGLLL